MSVFASQTQQTIALPFDLPHTVTVRKLTGREIERAQESHRGNLAAGSARAWSATFRRALEKGAGDPDVLKAIADPLTGYDRFVLVRAGLIGWSYPQALNGSSVSSTAHDAVEDLVDEAVDFIATEVLRLTKPRLFQTSDEAAVARKNG